MQRYLLIVQFIFYLSIGWPVQEAHAYLDPGTGSLLLQSLFAVIAALGAGISLFWGRLRNLFSKNHETNTATDQEGERQEIS